MFLNNPYILGLILVGTGVLIWLLVRLLFVIVSGRKQSKPLPEPSSLPPQSAHRDAVILIKSGGRIHWLNECAREWFGLKANELADIERLTRKIRPSDQFIELCAGERHTRLILDGRPVEGTSWDFPAEQETMRVVTLQAAELSSGLGGEKGGLTSHALQTFTELTQAMAASLDLDATLQAVLENIERLLPCDFAEITLWDNDAGVLVPYRLGPAQDGRRVLEQAQERYTPDKGYSGYLVKEKKPLLINDVGSNSALRPALDQQTFPIHSFLGISLRVGGELIGTLEIASLAVDTYQSGDLELMELVSGQAAIAIHNAQLFRAERRRIAELSSLAQLSQAFSSIRETGSLFDRLVHAVSALIPVKVIGFMVYNETTRVLEGQAPFQGIPAQFMDMYRVPVPVGSSLEKTFLDQDVIITEDASADEHWVALGLNPMAVAAGLKDTVMIPLASGGRILGYLQAANHHENGASFSQEELHLLMIVANQAAPIIENASLLLQSRQRAQRAEGLRRIASLASSAGTLDEILKFSLQELGRLLQADLAVIFLLDQNHTALQLHWASRYGNVPDSAATLQRVALEDPQYPFTAAGNQHAYLLDASRDDQPVIPYYRELMQSWLITSAVVVPLIIRDEGIGEIWLGSRKSSYFDQGDLQVVATAAGQLAGVVEQSTLFMQTDDSLRRRVDQMTALARINRELGTSLDLRHLLQMVHDEAIRTTRADCGTILFFDVNRVDDDMPKVRFFVGDSPGQHLSELELDVLNSGNPRVIQLKDAAGDLRPHSGVESVLLVPILHQNRPGGLISLHSRVPARFDSSAIEIAQSLAGQASIALNNAVLFEEQSRHGALLKRQLDTLNELFQVSSFLKPGQPLETVLKAIGQSIVDATPFRVVLLSVYDPNQGYLRRVNHIGISPEAWEELSSRIQPWRGVQQLCQDQYKIGNLYYIPADQQPLVPVDVHSVAILPSTESVEVDQWDTDDFLLAPLYSSNGQPLGLISVDDPRDGRRPDKPTLDALEIFAAQAALVIENHTFVSSLQSRVEELQAEADRLKEAASQSAEQVPALLRSQLDHIMEAQRLNRQLDRVRSGLEMVEKSSEQGDIVQSLTVLAKELLGHFGMQTALIGEKLPGIEKLQSVLGAIPEGANPEALFGQRNPLRQTLQDGQIRLVHQLEGLEDWKQVPLLSSLEARSFVVLPFEISQTHRAAILVVGQRTAQPFGSDEQSVYNRLCRQVSVSLQNLNFLAETRSRLDEVNLLLDFSRKLGSLDSNSILQALLESALQVIPSADAGWVGLVDETSTLLDILVSRGYSDSESLQTIHYTLDSNPAPIMVRAVKEREVILVNEIQFARDYLLPADDLLKYRSAARGRLPISTLAAPILLGDHALGVLILENFDQLEAFTHEHENLVLSLSRQAALGLENARLFQSAERRTALLESLTEAAGTMTSNLSSKALVASLLDHLRDVVPYDTATLWLRTGGQLGVAAARGFEDSESRIGITARVEDSAIFQEMSKTGKPVYVPDIRSDHRFTQLLVPDYVSWLGVPLLAKGELIGVIALEKKEANSYTFEAIQAASTFASQAAVAMENARLYEESVARAHELDQRSNRLALLNQYSSDLGASLDGDFVLNLTAERLIHGLDAEKAGILVLDDQEQTIHLSTFPAGTASMSLAVQDLPLLQHLMESRGVYYIEDVSGDPNIQIIAQSLLSEGKTGSLLMVPLATGQRVTGWLALAANSSRRYNPAEVELIRTVCNQAALALQNARQFAETRQLKEDLEKRVEERTTELRKEHSNSQTMLRVTTELSASLDLQQVLSRSLGILNEAIGAEESLILMGSSNQVYQSGQKLVEIVRGSEAEHSPAQQIHRWVMRLRVPAIVENLHDDERWTNRGGEKPEARSVLAVPLILGEETLGTLILLHREENYFGEDQIPMLQAVARQIAITLNNSELFGLIRDQAENLGGMLREQQIEASRSRAILEAVADGVLVTDAALRITLLNASAEKILDVEAGRLKGQPLDRFSSVFGQASKTWMQTIQRWSKGSAHLHNGESYADQIVLDNQRIVAIHLSPVIWRSDFLGTVSIFRDITHQVQADRLKSEFITNVSHELRTPLTSIKGFVDIMLKGAAGEVTDKQAHFLNIVKENTERLHILVSDLLDVSRIQSGKVVLEFQPLSLDEIARDVIHEVQEMSTRQSRPMNFDLYTQPGTREAYADRTRTQQILKSLVVNSFQYTPENGSIQVLIRPSEDGRVQVDVVDNGIGIQPEDQHRIFERFYRGDNPMVMATSGTGLGLALSKILIEMQNGELWFKSSGVPGEGSVFSFVLPAYQEEEEIHGENTYS